MCLSLGPSQSLVELKDALVDMLKSPTGFKQWVTLTQAKTDTIWCSTITNWNEAKRITCSTKMLTGWCVEVTNWFGTKCITGWIKTNTGWYCKVTNWFGIKENTDWIKTHSDEHVESRIDWE